MNTFLEHIFTLLEAFGNIIAIGVPHMDDLYGYDAYGSDDSDYSDDSDDSDYSDDSDDSDYSDDSDDSCDSNDDRIDINDINNKRLNQYMKVHKEARELFELKNKDYGDSFANYGTVGVLMRMKDKLNRYQSITRNGVTLVDDEQLRDTLIDLHNYSAMAVMLLDE